MRGQGRALRIVLSVAVVVAVTVVNGAAALLLTAEETGAVGGGCTQYYCKAMNCGSPHACSLDETGYCTPGETCKNTETYSRGEIKWNCGSLVNNGNPCTKGPMTGCGLLASCICYRPFGSSTYICGTYDPIEDPYAYYPCN
jgi:hypothetical protein